MTVPNPDRALKPEMFAMVRIDAAPQPDALAVPLAAVQQDGGGKVLFVRQPERRFELRRVRLGMSKTGTSSFWKDCVKERTWSSRRLCDQVRTRHP